MPVGEVADCKQEHSPLEGRVSLGLYKKLSVNIILINLVTGNPLKYLQHEQHISLANRTTQRLNKQPLL